MNEQRLTRKSRNFLRSQIITFIFSSLLLSQQITGKKTGFYKIPHKVFFLCLFRIKVNFKFGT
jgi:hypothetical protein